MIKIDNSNFKFKIKQENRVDFIFDDIRKRWIILQPEEWVRQNFIKYLCDVLHYPKSLIAVEKLVKVGELTKRFDIVVYKESKVWMLIECKEPDVKIDTNVLEQLLSYQSSLHASYIICTNGNTNLCCKIENNNLNYLEEMPKW